MGGLPPPDVAEAYAALGSGDPAVAVRSSAVAEDSGEASFAGQQETYLHVRGADSVAASVRDCWASFFSERALFYRGQKGSLDDLEMAVVVQRMVEPDVAGILFTVDPVQRRRDRMVVEAVFGLGETAVSGSVTPDNYVIARDGSSSARASRSSRTRSSACPAAARRSAALARGRRPRDARRGRPAPRSPSSAACSRSTTARPRTSSGRSPAASSTCCSRAP